MCRRNSGSRSMAVDDTGASSGDYLQGFLRGTRGALYESGRPSLTISIDVLNAFSLGMLIGLYERAVSFYASLIHVNAYHQPGVEAGKKAAGEFLDLLERVRTHLAQTGGAGVDAETMATNLGESDIEAVYHCLNHLAGNGFASRADGQNPALDVFSC